MSATGRGSKRQAQDFYPTPDYTVDSLLEYIQFSTIRSFLEPCKGDGAIFDKIPQVPVKHYCELSEDKDYFAFGADQKYDLIVTNPPYSQAQEFVEKSLSEARTVCYLLRLDFLGAQKRKEWWNRIGTPDKLLVLSKRPKFVNNKSDANEYGWFIWDYGSYIHLSKGIHVV